MGQWGLRWKTPEPNDIERYPTIREYEFRPSHLDFGLGG